MVPTTMALLLSLPLQAASIPSPVQQEDQHHRSSEFDLKAHQAMQKMEEGMQSAPMTGDPDHDFVQMMIPHHQGAIDMAKAILESGTDPEIRLKAEKFVIETLLQFKLMDSFIIQATEAYWRLGNLN